MACIDACPWEGTYLRHCFADFTKFLGHKIFRCVESSTIRNMPISNQCLTEQGLLNPKALKNTLWSLWDLASL